MAEENTRKVNWPVSSRVGFSFQMIILFSLHNLNLSICNNLSVFYKTICDHDIIFKQQMRLADKGNTEC